MDVGAGDVHLEPADLRAGVEFLADLDVFIERKAADIRHDGLVENTRELGKLLGDDRVYAGILKSHGVEHAALHFSDARLGIAETRLARRSLERERTETVDVVQFRELVPVAKCAARGNDGVVERKRTECDVRFYHLISSLPNTFTADALGAVYRVDRAAHARAEAAAHARFQTDLAGLVRFCTKRLEHRHRPAGADGVELLEQRVGHKAARAAAAVRCCDDGLHAERLEFIFVKNILRSVETQNGDGRFARGKKAL